MKKLRSVVLLFIIFSSLLALFSCSTKGKLRRSRKQKKSFRITRAHPNYKEIRADRSLIYISGKFTFYHGKPFKPVNQICEIPAETFIKPLGRFRDGKRIVYHIKYRGIEGFAIQNKGLYYYTNFTQIDKASNIQYSTTEPAPVWKYPPGEEPILLETLPQDFSFFSSKKVGRSKGSEFFFIELETGETGIVHRKSLKQLTSLDVGEPDLRLFCLEDIPVYNTYTSKQQKQIHLFKKGDFILAYNKIALYKMKSDDGSDYFMVSFNNQYGYIKKNISPRKKTVRIWPQNYKVYSIADVPFFNVSDKDSRKKTGTIPKGDFFHILGRFEQEESEKMFESENYYYVEYKEKKGVIETTGKFADSFLYEFFERNGIIYGVQSFTDYEHPDQAPAPVTIDAVKVVNGNKVTTRKDLLIEDWDYITSFQSRSDIIQGKDLLEIKFNGFIYGKLCFGFLYYEFSPDGAIGNCIFSYYTILGAQGHPRAELKSIEFSDTSALLEYEYYEAIGMPNKGKGKISLKFQYNPQKDIFELFDFKTEDIALPEDWLSGEEEQQSITYHTPQTLNKRFREGYFPKKYFPDYDGGLFPDHDFIFGVK